VRDVHLVKHRRYTQNLSVVTGSGFATTTNFLISEVLSDTRKVQMGACIGCGLECPDDATLCYACALAVARGPDHSPMTGPSQAGNQPYGWGKIQGVLLIIGGLGQFSREASPSGLESDPYAAALNIVLGFCILRRNRLILPLMVIAIVLLMLNIGLGFIRNDKTTTIFVFGLFVWVLYAFYYYYRRHEFKRWI
jgi:hypothetical protein